MKYFFDTSVLVPVFLDDHVHHEASLAALLNSSKKDSCCAAHTLAEVYSTLTRMPARARATPEEAILFLETLSGRLSFITLDSDEYWSVLKKCGESGVVGGRIYDALLAQCAAKAKTEVLYTWNVADFLQFKDVAKRVRTP